jgi:hypothetical protein
MLPDTAIWDALFSPEGGHTCVTYAILDGAACEDLLPKLEEHRPDYGCLYAGDLNDDLKEVAPYLIRLEANSTFTIWLLNHIGQSPWGIFCKAPSTVLELRKHFRKFLIVKGPEGNDLYFRFYDPRVLSVFLPTCEADQVQELFGPINAYVTANGQGELVNFTHKRGSIAQRIIAKTTPHT